MKQPPLDLNQSLRNSNIKMSATMEPATKAPLTFAPEDNKSLNNALDQMHDEYHATEPAPSKGNPSSLSQHAPVNASQ